MWSLMLDGRQWVSQSYLCSFSDYGWVFVLPGPWFPGMGLKGLLCCPDYPLLFASHCGPCGAPTWNTRDFWTGEPGGLLSLGSHRVGHDWSDLAAAAAAAESNCGEGNGTPLSTLAWKIPWMEDPGRLQSMGSLRVGHDWATSLSLFTFMHWRRKWHPTPVLLPGESQGQRSLVGCRLWGCTESDMTEAT